MAYKGFTVPLPLGLSGFSGTRNQSRLDPSQLSYVDAVDIDGSVLRKEGGASKYNSSALGAPSSVLAGINWSAVPAQRYDVVFLDNGDVLRDDGDGSFGTTLASGLSSSDEPPPVFVEGGGEAVGEGAKLFLFSALNQVQVVAGTGSSLAAINDPPSDWASSQFPTFGVLHAARMWGGGNASDPHRIYYSSTGDHQDFATNGGTLSIYPGEGEALVGGISFNGLLVLWKYPSGVYSVDTRDPSTSNWSVNRLSRAVGGVNQQSIVQIENDVVFLDHAGNIHRLSRTERFGDITSSDIGQEAELGPFMRQSINLGVIRKAAGLWYPARSQAWFMIPRIGEVDNGIRLVADFSDQQIEQRFLLSRRDMFASLWARPDVSGVQRPTGGDLEGFVWNLDQETRQKDGSAYDMDIESATMDFGWAQQELAHKVKNGQFLELVADVTSPFTVNVTVLWDEEVTDSLVFDVGSAGRGLGTFELGTDVLGSAGIATLRRRIAGSGRRLKLILSNDAIEDVRISEMRVAFTVGDEDANT